MNLSCKVGRHHWVTRQEMGETGQAEAYQQCDRCGHYPKTSRWPHGDASTGQPLDPQHGGAGGGGGVIA